MAEKEWFRLTDQRNLRPIEAVILRLRNDGHPAPEIAKRTGKRPGTVRRILEMVEHKANIPVQQSSRPGEGRPVERVIRRLRDRGETYGQIGNRLNISGSQAKRIEEMAQLR